MRRLLCALLAAGLLAGLAASPAGAAGKTVSGDVTGSDFRAVDVFLGIDLQDAAGRVIDRNGCLKTQCGLAGYAITMRLNPDLGPEGSTDRSRWTARWVAALPSNAATMFIEAYPRNAGQYGTTNDIRYGRALRRFSVPGSLSNVHVRLPLQCSQGGGTGVITGTTRVGGAARQVSRVSAFAIGADNNGANPILGFNIGTSAADGTLRIPSLAPNSRYRVFAVYSGVQKSTDVVVGRCATSRVAVTF